VGRHDPSGLSFADTTNVGDHLCEAHFIGSLSARPDCIADGEYWASCCWFAEALLASNVTDHPPWGLMLLNTMFSWLSPRESFAEENRLARGRWHAAWQCGAMPAAIVAAGKGLASSSMGSLMINMSQTTMVCLPDMIVLAQKLSPPPPTALPASGVLEVPLPVQFAVMLTAHLGGGFASRWQKRNLDVSRRPEAMHDVDLRHQLLLVLRYIQAPPIGAWIRVVMGNDVFDVPPEFSSAELGVMVLMPVHRPEELRKLKRAASKVMEVLLDMRQRFDACAWGIRPACCCNPLCSSLLPSPTTGRLPKGKACSGCDHDRYCSTDCQRQHWPLHKHACKAAAQRNSAA